MSQVRDVIEQKGPNQIVRIRRDSETNLDDLFKAVLQPKDSQVQLSRRTVPMRLRNLPPSFFQQPETKSASHSRDSSCDATFSPTCVSPAPGAQHSVSTNINNSLQVHHPRANSSPASLEQTYTQNSGQQHQHLRQHSYDNMIDDAPLPSGWEMAITSLGQRYFLNHETKTTTWEDPRKAVNISSVTGTRSSNPPVSSGGGNLPSVNVQSLGSLPDGWEQASTPEGEVYFINHKERTTSWFDPRIMLQLGKLQLQQTGVPSQPDQEVQVSSTSSGTLESSPTVTMVTANPDSSATLQQQLRLQKLQMEREQLRMRQQEILRQPTCLGNPMLKEILLRRSLGEENPSLPTSPTGNVPTLTSPSGTGLDPFLAGTDFHSRQESGDSGLGLSSNLSLPRTPDNFLMLEDGLETGDPHQHTGTEIGSEGLQNTNLDLGMENMDSDDLLPSLQEDFMEHILSDVLNANKDNMMTWV
ncbi:transcriptional coactivator YAP1-like isoform X2 [Tachypleus tridentatus]|uniref:transcriptional coactivator YAP1-like isoform X2 n=1 Tax=Tachypleus tridentatus TaxID=6853 RepID=UPI003FD62990